MNSSKSGLKRPLKDTVEREYFIKDNEFKHVPQPPAILHHNGSDQYFIRLHYYSRKGEKIKKRIDVYARHISKDHQWKSVLEAEIYKDIVWAAYSNNTSFDVEIERAKGRKVNLQVRVPSIHRKLNGMEAKLKEKVNFYQ